MSRLVRRMRAYRRYRARYIAAVEQLSRLTNQQLNDIGIDRSEIADRARLSARGLGAVAAR